MKRYVLDVLRSTSVQGFVHFTYLKRHPLEHAAWVVFIAAAATGAFAMCFSTWDHYQNSPTVISMEHNYMEWPIVFPAIYICPKNNSNTSKIEYMVKELAGSNETLKLETIKRFLSAIENSFYFNFSSLQEFVNDTSLPQFDFLSLILEMSFTFSYKSATAVLKDKLFDKTITEAGICYGFNSMVAKYSSPRGEVQTKKNTSKLIYGNALEKGFTISFTNINSDYMVHMNPPNEILDVGVILFSTKELTMSELDISALETYSTPEVRQLSVQQRKCRFDDESNLDFSPVYSHNLCRMHCRMKFAIELCNCLPFWYNVSWSKECDVKGMLCLDKYREDLIRLKNRTSNTRFPCNCYPSCEEFNFFKWNLGFIVIERNFGAATLNLKLAKHSRIRLKRDVLFSKIDLLVSFGGAVGLFLGSSVLSFVEIVYYFTLRLFFFTRREHHR